MIDEFATFLMARTIASSQSLVLGWLHSRDSVKRLGYSPSSAAFITVAPHTALRTERTALRTSAQRMIRTELRVHALLALLVFTALAYAPGVSSKDQAVVLENYISNTNLIPSRGFWYNIVTWAARTHNCDNRPESVACMACCMNLPQFGWEAGVAPLGVGNDLWFIPERGATCGLCLRVYMPPRGIDNCSYAESDPACAGTGYTPYYPNVAEKWAYGARIYWDEALRLHYFIGMVVEWFDRNQSLPSAITYPTQGKNTDDFGSWPILWRAVPCPVGRHHLTFHFLNATAEHPVEPTNESGWVHSAPSVGVLPNEVTRSLCDNEFSKPCAMLATVSSSRPPLSFIKLMVAGSRVPVTGVAIQLNGTWYSMERSGDNYWEPVGFYPIDPVGPVTPTDPWKPLAIRVYCTSDPHKYVEQNGLVPGNCMCRYQDPDCQPCEGYVQC